MISKHVEVLRHMRETIKAIAPSEVAALDAAIASLSTQQPPAEAHCTTCSCVPGMTPAVRLDTTPAEKEGAVRDHLIRIGWTPPAEAQAQGGGEVVYQAKDETLGAWYDVAKARWDNYDSHLRRAVYTAPPSAPVGVPAGVVREYLDARACYDPSTQHPNSPEGLRLREARNDLDAALYLAQQPSAAPALPLPGDRGGVQALFNPQPPAEAQPEPNWCRTCGRRPHDPVAALCPDTHHRKASPPRAPVGVDGVKCPWDGGSPCVEPRPIGMVYPMKPAPRASGYLDGSGVEWNAWDAEQMEAYARAAYSDGWEAGYRSALAQQPAAVDEAMVERIAALLREEATDEPWAVAGVEHDGPDRDYYRTLARKVLARAGKQPAASDELTELVRLLDEVRSHFTRDDDLPGDLLPRIDAALAQQPAPNAPVGAEGLIARWRKEAEGFDCGMSDGTGGALEACADDLEAALAQQPAAVDDAMVERATMALLGKTHDSAPGVDWRCDRSWTVNRVRELMRLALSAALAGQQGGHSDE